MAVPEINLGAAQEVEGFVFYRIRDKTMHVGVLPARGEVAGRGELGICFVKWRHKE